MKSASNCDERRVIAIAAAFAQTLHGGEIVFLEGALGAGKTTFVRAMLTARGWKGSVSSPSFPLVQTYETPLVSWVHIDLYRLDAAQDAEDLDDQLDVREVLGRSPTITLVEWASHCPKFRASVLRRAHRVGIKPTEVLLEIVEDPSKTQLRNVKLSAI